MEPVHDDVDLSTEEIFALPEDEAFSLVEFRSEGTHGELTVDSSTR